MHAIFPTIGLLILVPICIKSLIYLYKDYQQRKKKYNG